MNELVPEMSAEIIIEPNETTPGTPALWSQRETADIVPDGSISRWYALYVRSRHEKVVESFLNGKGYSVFAPCHRVVRKRADRSVEIDVPLFPGYVFCHFDAARLLPIVRTPGVVTIVGAGSTPQPIEDRDIDSIHRLLKYKQPVPWPYVAVGQRVRIQAGPLSGIEGILMQVKNERRLITSVQLLQRSVAVEIDQDVAVPVA